jgi:hypothetical protein
MWKWVPERHAIMHVSVIEAEMLQDGPLFDVARQCHYSRLDVIELWNINGRL